MKITAPDHEEVPLEPKSEDETGFKKEIKDILKIPSIQSKYIVGSAPSDCPDFKLQMLHKFTQFSREEMIPRNEKAAEFIESKINELQSQMKNQEKECQHLAKERVLLGETNKRIEATRLMVHKKHLELSERLKVTLQALKNQCANKTVAERKMAQDLKHFEVVANNLRVKMTESSAKVKYYNNQMNAQMEVARKLTKPLYLDKNRVVFIRSNLTSMQTNIQEMVNRIKGFNKQMPMLTAPSSYAAEDEDENSLRNEESELATPQH